MLCICNLMWIGKEEKNVIGILEAVKSEEVEIQYWPSHLLFCFHPPFFINICLFSCRIRRRRRRRVKRPQRAKRKKAKVIKRHPKRIKGHRTEEEYKVQIRSKSCSTLMPAWGSKFKIALFYFLKLINGSLFFSFPFRMLCSLCGTYPLHHSLFILTSHCLPSPSLPSTLQMFSFSIHPLPISFLSYESMSLRYPIKQLFN